MKHTPLCSLAVIGMVVGCAQIVIAVVTGKKGADSSEVQEDIQAKLCTHQQTYPLR